MKRLDHALSLAAALALVLAPPVAKAETLAALGTVTSAGTSKNNNTTATPFTLPASATGHVSTLHVAIFFAVQCDAPAYVIAGTTGSSLSVSSSTGIYVSANAAPLPLGPPNSSVNSIAVISVSGTANCKVFEVYSPTGY